MMVEFALKLLAGMVLLYVLMCAATVIPIVIVNTRRRRLVGKDGAHVHQTSWIDLVTVYTILFPVLYLCAVASYWIRRQP